MRELAVVSLPTDSRMVDYRRKEIPKIQGLAPHLRGEKGPLGLAPICDSHPPKVGYGGDAFP